MALRTDQPGQRGVMTRLLAFYPSVGALLADAHGVFSRVRASYFLVADEPRVLEDELGLQGRFATCVVTCRSCPTIPANPSVRRSSCLIPPPVTVPDLSVKGFSAKGETNHALPEPGPGAMLMSERMP